MSAVLVTASELARTLGVSHTAVAKARDQGRLTMIGDRFDLNVAKIQWAANRKRARPGQAPGAVPAQAANEAAPEIVATGSAYWEAKTRREAAEASLAELKEAELRGDLVRRAVVERELASRLVALRESLEVLADRLAALVAAESDASVCRRLLREEHRKALTGFAGAIAAAASEAGAGEEAPDGSA